VPTSTIARESENRIADAGGAGNRCRFHEGVSLASLRCLLDLRLLPARHVAFLSDEDERKLVQGLIEVPRLMAATLAIEPQIEKLARDIAKSKDVLYLGRGTSYPLALEGALKFERNFVYSCRRVTPPAN